jgi:hypothetical protein
MANHDKQFSLTGTADFVEQSFGFWSDSQALVVTGAAADISFDGTNVAATMTPGTATAALAWSDHRRHRIFVRGVGATVRVLASEGAEV